MSSRLVSVLMLSCCLTPCLLAEAQDAKNASELYAEAVNAYFAKDYNAADSVLSGVIEEGTRDPRTFYVRGLSRYASGNVDAAEIDFEAGARLEHSGLSQVNVPRSLERVQGKSRQALEKFRRKAQQNAALASKIHRKDRALQEISANGKAAFLAGKSEVAVSLLDIAASNGSSDPRVFYFRGLAKEQLGLSDEAAVDFKRAIGLEIHPANQINVDLALESVQGELRIALEQHRHAVISSARQASDKARQQMIASLLDQRAADAAAGKTSTGAVAKSAIGLPAAATTPSATVAPGSPAKTTPPAAGTGSAGASTAVNVAWLPVRAEVIINVNVRELWSSPMLDIVKESPETKASLQQMQNELNMQPRDIDSVTVALSDVTELAMAGAADPTALASGTDQVVMVIRTRSPFDPQIVQRRTDDFEAATHDGKPFYRALNEDMPCVYLPDSKTVVLAEEEPLKAAIEQGADAADRPEFAFMDASRHVAVAWVPNDPFALTEQIPTEGSGSDALDRLATALKDQLLGIGLGVSLSDSVELEFRVLCVDGPAATEVDASLADLINEGKGLWGFAKGEVPAPIAGLVDSIIRAQKNSATNEVASVSTRISGQSIERAIASAEEMLPMLMMQAMGGLGGPGSSGVQVGIGELDDPPEPPKATKPAEGLTVKSTAQISSSIDLDDDGKEKPKAIELVLDITGDQAKAASGVGFPAVTAAKDNNGDDLTMRIAVNFGDGGFEAIDREDFFVKHPEDGCRTMVSFDPPAEAATEIATAEGIVKLRIVENSSQVVVDNAKSLLGKDIESPELIAAGYQLKLSEKKEKFGDDEFVSWQLDWVNAGASKIRVQDIANGGGLGLQIPELVDADGNVIADFSNTSYTSFGASSSLSWGMPIQDDQPVPDDARLRFTLNNEVSIVDVAFKVENVAIGPEDDGF
jgi:tetratricopeptide (TPR) repeat protein